jgi:uncharacterized protein (DUF1697 family)
MARFVALLRGINVGTAARISMADLRGVVESLGYTGVRTHLQSGNVVFDADHPVGTAEVSRLESAVASASGVSPRIVVVAADRFRRIADDNPMGDAADPARMVVTFFDTVPEAARAERPSDAELAPERIVFGTDAVYQWLPDGVLKTKLPPRFIERLASVATSRNLRTVTKIVAMLDG